MIWFILSILSGLSFSLARAISRFYLKKQGDALAFTAIHDFIAGLVLLPFIFIGFHWPSQAITWWCFIGIIIFAFLSDYLAFTALKTVNISIYQIVIQIRHIFILFGGSILFAEAITAGKLLAVALIIGGVMVALYQKTRIDWTRGITLTVLSTLAAVVSFVFAKLAVRDFSEIAAASLELMAIGLLSFSLMKFNAKTLSREFKINKLGLVLAGFFFGICEISLFAALKIGDISKVIPATQSSLVFGVLIGIIFMGEREKMARKIIGMLVMAAGVILLY